MDLLQEQVLSLNTRVDALHRTVEQLTLKISDVLSELKASSNSGNSYANFAGSVNRPTYFHRGNTDPSMEHKDVLADRNYPDVESQNGERTLSPEVQIQRLTAQLTAAYNRIAALEEQLLAKRIHS